MHAPSRHLPLLLMLTWSSQLWPECCHPCMQVRAGHQEDTEASNMLNRGNASSRPRSSSIRHRRWRCPCRRWCYYRRWCGSESPNSMPRPWASDGWQCSRGQIGRPTFGLLPFLNYARTAQLGPPSPQQCSCRNSCPSAGCCLLPCRLCQGQRSDARQVKTA